PDGCCDIHDSQLISFRKPQREGLDVTRRFLFNPTAPTEIHTLSLHDALPICPSLPGGEAGDDRAAVAPRGDQAEGASGGEGLNQDRKSTRLNSSHLGISYAVFCLKKKINPMYDGKADGEVKHGGSMPLRSTTA